MKDAAGKRSSNYISHIALPVLIAIILLFGMLYVFRYSGFEKDDVFIPPLAKSDNLKIPPRPGIQGIVITGPIIEDLIFDIDLSAAGLKALNWDRLVGIDRTARVTIRATVNKRGKLLFRRRNNDIKDSGHPDAGRYIEEVLSTWTFFPYKTGTIRFYFNVASKGKKLTIDTRNLEKNSDIPGKIRVLDGRMFYITGLDIGEVGYGTVSF